MKGIVLWLVLIVVIALTVCDAFFPSGERCQPNCENVRAQNRLSRGVSISIRRNRDKRDVGQYVYRALRPDENPDVGLKAKDPNARKSIPDHIRYGGLRNKNYKTQYISTTTSKDVAKGFAKKSGNRIVKIDTYIAKREGCKIIDISKGQRLDEYLDEQVLAIQDKEVLFTGCVIPASAIEIVSPTKPALSQSYSCSSRDIPYQAWFFFLFSFSVLLLSF